MTELLTPASIIGLSAPLPEIVRSCLLIPIQPPAEEEDDEVWIPTPPGVNYDDLPDPPVIFDTSPDQIIGCIENTGTNPQVRLNALFPTRAEEDGVIERLNNDIWVYRNSTWVNVGPTPGPTVVVDRVLPFWNEKIVVVALTSTFVSILSRAYSFNLFTDLIETTKTKIQIKTARLVKPPVLDIATSFLAPSVRGGAATTIVEKILSTGTEPPVLGASQVNPVTLATDAGWTLLYNDTRDEGSTQVGDFGFTFKLNTVSYSSCYVNSNSYITFGAQQNVFSSLSASNPALPKIHISPGDFSCQRIYVKKEKEIYRIRWEGNASYSASAGDSNRFIEINFHKALGDGTQYLEIRSGNISGSTGGPFMIATADTALASSIFTANESWVFIGNEDGTTWTIESGKYIERKLSIAVLIPSADATNTSINAYIPVVVSGGSVSPDTETIEAISNAPNISTGVSANIPASAVSIGYYLPDGIGYRVAIEPSTLIIQANAGNPNISSGGSASLEPFYFEILAQVPSVITGADITVNTVSLTVFIDSPVVSTGATLAIPGAEIELQVSQVNVSAGASFEIPSANITINTVIPDSIGKQTSIIEPAPIAIAISSITPLVSSSAAVTVPSSGMVLTAEQPSTLIFVRPFDIDPIALSLSNQPSGATFGDDLIDSLESSQSQQVNIDFIQIGL